LIFTRTGDIKNEKVLLVNDSKFESMILKDMLVSIGYIAGIADEYDAIERYRTCVLIILL